MGRPREKIRGVSAPSFMAGRLHDVWFVPAGRQREREKIGVTLEPERWRKAAPEKLEVMVKERYGGGRLHRAKNSKIEITNRPEGDVVYRIVWGGG